MHAKMMGQERVLRTYGHHRRRVVTTDSEDIFGQHNDSHGSIFSSSSSESGFGPSESINSEGSISKSTSNTKTGQGGRTSRQAKNKALESLQAADKREDTKPNKRKRQPKGKQAFIFASDKDSGPSSCNTSFTPPRKRVTRKALNDLSNASSGPPASAVKQRAQRKRQAAKKNVSSANSSKESNHQSAYNFSDFDNYSLVISDSPLMTGDAGTSISVGNTVGKGTSTPCQSERTRPVSLTPDIKPVDLSHISPLIEDDVHGDGDMSVSEVLHESPSIFACSKEHSGSGMTEYSSSSGDHDSKLSSDSKVSSDFENLQRLEDSFASMRVGRRRLRKRPTRAENETSQNLSGINSLKPCSPEEDDRVVIECKDHVNRFREQLLKKNLLVDTKSAVSVKEKFNGSLSLFDCSSNQSLYQLAERPQRVSEGKAGKNLPLSQIQAEKDKVLSDDEIEESDASESDKTLDSDAEKGENLSAIEEDEEVDEEDDYETEDSAEEREDENDEKRDSVAEEDDAEENVSTKNCTTEILDETENSPVLYMLTSTSYLGESPRTGSPSCQKIHKEAEEEKEEEEDTETEGTEENENNDSLIEADQSVAEVRQAAADINQSVDGQSPVRYMLTSTSYLSGCDDLSCSHVSQLEESILDQSCKLTATPSRSFGEVLTPSRRKSETEDDSDIEPSSRERVLEQCSQEAPVPFSAVIPPSVMKKCIKIGEGVYGEVFRTTRGGQSVALKIIPIEGDFPVNDEPQKTFAEILPEIVISNELSGLRNGTVNCTYNFCPVRSVSCVKGGYPAELLKQWDIFHEKKTSENDRPDVFGPEQLYILFEFGDGGSDLESCKLDSAAQAVSVLQQVACALAVAEEEMQFEHRDLHIGNVLVQKTSDTTVTVNINGSPVFVDTFGVHVSIIDFTLSRLTKDGCTVFCDLATDDTLFEGKGDYQFDIYRMMKKENKNNWEPFNPHTNILWLHYLCDKLISRKHYSADDRSHREALKCLRRASKTLLQYQSAVHFVLEDDFFQT